MGVDEQGWGNARLGEDFASRRAVGEAITRSRRRRTRRRRWFTVAALALAGAIAWTATRPTPHATPTEAPAQAKGQPSGLARSSSQLSAALADGLATGLARSADEPPRSAEEQSSPIGHPAPLPASSGPFTFLATQTDGRTPVAYDPCRPIHYVVNSATAPADGQALLINALARVTLITGLRFINDGPTNETPSNQRSAYQPATYPGRWAPVLIAWTDPTHDPALGVADPDGGTVAGEGGSISVSPSNGQPAIYVTGSVSLDGPLLKLVESRRGGGPAAVRAIIEHELGHLVGLGHVNDPFEIMNPSETPGTTDYGPGDRRGLSQLGSGQCEPDI